MPAHHRDPRGSTPYDKRQRTYAPEGQCATCPRTLTTDEQRKCLRRCHACRKLNPGRPTPSTVIVKPRASEPAPRSSWWTDSQRENFTAVAAQQKYSQDAKAMVLKVWTVE